MFFFPRQDKGALKAQIIKLASMFVANFKKYEADAGAEISAAGPQ